MHDKRSPRWIKHGYLKWVFMSPSRKAEGKKNTRTSQVPPQAARLCSQSSAVSCTLNHGKGRANQKGTNDRNTTRVCSAMLHFCLSFQPGFQQKLPLTVWFASSLTRLRVLSSKPPRGNSFLEDFRFCRFPLHQGLR